MSPGDPAVYQPHGGPPEDGVVESVIDSERVMVRYRNGPQNGKTCCTYVHDLTPTHPEER